MFAIRGILDEQVMNYSDSWKMASLPHLLTLMPPQVLNSDLGMLEAQLQTIVSPNFVLALPSFEVELRVLAPAGDAEHENAGCLQHAGGDV